jgi:hypothetical protein
MQPTAFLERLRTSAIGQKIIAEDEQTTELVEELAQLTREHERALPALVKAEEKALDRLQQARAAVRDAERAHLAAMGERQSATSRLDSARSQREAQLRASAPEAIDAFLQEIARLADDTRANGLRFEDVHVGIIGRSFARISNAVSVRTRLEALSEARLAAEALKLEALAPKQLAERISAIREGIPQVTPPQAPPSLVLAAS